MTQHIEEARKLEPEWRYEIQYGPEGEANYAWIYKGDLFVATMRTHHAVEIVKAIAALAAAEERGRSGERERCAKAHDVLAGLSSFLGAGLGDESTTAEQYDKRIRWGIDELQSSIIRICMEKVERCSELPSTTWGEVKASLASILPPAITKEPTT